MTVFAHVAAARSFSAAARELGISQATASKHVQTLENWLGARLLHRTTRRVGLTDVGASFYTQCTRILEDMEAARLAGHAAGMLHGSLRIIAPVAFGSTRLAALATDFMARHPDLSLIVTLSDRQVDLIEEGYDLAIRIGSMPDEAAGLIGYRLRLLHLVVCATPAYLDAFGWPGVPGDLAAHCCLTDGHHQGDVWRFAGPGGDIEVAVSGRLKTDNALLRLQAARNGLGIVLAPELLLEDDLKAGTLVRVLPGFTPPPKSLDAICSPYRGSAPKVQSFVSFLTAALREAE